MNNEKIFGETTFSEGKEDVLPAREIVASAFLSLKERFPSFERFTVRSELSGHNNQVNLIDLHNERNDLVGSACLKYSFGEKMKTGLRLEADILRTLYENIPCSRVLDSGFLRERNFSYILMDVVEEESFQGHTVDIRQAELVLDAIQLHEVVLQDKKEVFAYSPIVGNLSRKIDFESKLSTFLRDVAPNFKVEVPMKFLNSSLNGKDAISKRVMVTDRSAENMFIGRRGEIVMIDFSTVRAGTQFDNWIQFIDDPRISFSCTKGDLVDLFFEKTGLSKEGIDLFYAASIYTNALQGIFTHQKDPVLGRKYISNANESFEKLNKKKGTFIDFNHEYAL